VDVVRPRAGRQSVGHVINGDHVVVVYAVLVALVGGVNESGPTASFCTKRVWTHPISSEVQQLRNITATDRVSICDSQ
jgi:hypothetical protein